MIPSKVKTFTATSTSSYSIIADGSGSIGSSSNSSCNKPSSCFSNNNSDKNCNIVLQQHPSHVEGGNHRRRVCKGMDRKVYTCRFCNVPSKGHYCPYRLPDGSKKTKQESSLLFSSPTMQQSHPSSHGVVISSQNNNNSTNNKDNDSDGKRRLTSELSSSFVHMNRINLPSDMNASSSSKAIQNVIASEKVNRSINMNNNNINTKITPVMALQGADNSMLSQGGTVTKRMDTIQSDIRSYNTTRNEQPPQKVAIANNFSTYCLPFPPSSSSEQDLWKKLPTHAAYRETTIIPTTRSDTEKQMDVGKTADPYGTTKENPTLPHPKENGLSLSNPAKLKNGLSSSNPAKLSVPKARLPGKNHSTRKLQEPKPTTLSSSFSIMAAHASPQLVSPSNHRNKGCTKNGTKNINNDSKKSVEPVSTSISSKNHVRNTSHRKVYTCRNCGVPAKGHKCEKAIETTGTVTVKTPIAATTKPVTSWSAATNTAPTVTINGKPIGLGGSKCSGAADINVPPRMMNTISATKGGGKISSNGINERKLSTDGNIVSCNERAEKPVNLMFNGTRIHDSHLEKSYSMPKNPINISFEQTLRDENESSRMYNRTSPPVPDNKMIECPKLDRQPPAIVSPVGCYNKTNGLLDVLAAAVAAMDADSFHQGSEISSSKPASFIRNSNLRLSESLDCNSFSSDEKISMFESDGRKRENESSLHPSKRYRLGNMFTPLHIIHDSVTTENQDAMGVIGTKDKSDCNKNSDDEHSIMMAMTNQHQFEPIDHPLVDSVSTIGKKKNCDVVTDTENDVILEKFKLQQQRQPEQQNDGVRRVSCSSSTTTRSDTLVQHIQSRSGSWYKPNYDRINTPQHHPNILHSASNFLEMIHHFSSNGSAQS